MEITLSWIAGVIGVLGAAFGLAVGLKGERGNETRAVGVVSLFAVAATVIIFLLTRPIDAPFSAGQRLGYGVLIGGLLGAIAGLLSSRVPMPSSWNWGLKMIGLQSLALIGVAAVLIIFPGYPQPALFGIAIGAVVAAIIFRLAVSPLPEMDIWALTSVTLASATILAALRFDQASDRFWWRTPAMIFAAAIVGQLAAASTGTRGRFIFDRAGISSPITLALTAVFAWKLFPDWSLLWVAITGAITFILITWLAARSPESTRAASVGAVVVVALTAVAFRFLGGFGVGIALLAAWPVIIGSIASRREDGTDETVQSVIYATFIGVGVLMFRLFLENYADSLRGTDLRAHYTMISLVMGAVFPFVLISFFPILPNRGPILRSIGAGAAGLFSALAPLTIVMLWGMKATLGFVVGSIAAEVVVLLLYMGAIVEAKREYLTAALLVLTAQLSAVVFSDFVMPLSDASRLTRIFILAAALVVGLIWSGISAVFSPRPQLEG